MRERTFRFTTDQGHAIHVVVQPESVDLPGARTVSPYAKVIVGGWQMFTPQPFGAGNVVKVIDKMIELGAEEITQG